MQRRNFFKAMVVASLGVKSMLAQQKGITPPPPADSDDPELPHVHGLVDTKPLPMTLAPDALAQTQANFFTERQFATLRRLCETLMPPQKGYPGAIDAGTPEFLDFLIGVSLPDRQQMYQSGLDRLDADSRQRLGVSFAEAKPADIDQLLRPWLKAWIADHPPVESYEHFINVAHLDIRTATINSLAWSRASKAAGQKDRQLGLYWKPIDPDAYRESTRRMPIRPSTHGALHS